MVVRVTNIGFVAIVFHASNSLFVIRTLAVRTKGKGEFHAAYALYTKKCIMSACCDNHDQVHRLIIKSNQFRIPQFQQVISYRPSQIPSSSHPTLPYLAPSLTPKDLVDQWASLVPQVLLVSMKG